MKNSSVILGGKLLSKTFKTLNLGNGSTWPGHLALKINPHFVEEILKNSQTKVIIVAGTNGKTTTTRMIRTILEENNHTLIHNESGANLLNGIASTLLLQAKANGTLQADYAIFEVDENALPKALAKITPDYLILLNLFRDQLDRYGEVDSIAKKWEQAIKKLQKRTTLILNADDPRVAYLGQDFTGDIHYFGLDKTTTGSTSEYAADSLFCPRCGEKLIYTSKTYSHLGNWHCPHCHLKRPAIEKVSIPYLPLSGTYNEYNMTSVILLMQLLSVPEAVIENALHHITPAFGRQEIIEVRKKKVQLFLSKNPTGFNESLRTITEQGAKHVLLILNDRVADGHDVSWIWDVDFESFLPNFDSITISGDRCYDMGLRMKYSDQWEMVNGKWQMEKVTIQDNLQEAITTSLEKVIEGETLYILPTYTAMLEVRKILKGRKIL